MTAAAILAAYCLLVFGAVPPLLARAEWPARAPRAAIALWQTLGLSGCLAAIGSGLAVAVAPFGTSLALGARHMIANGLAGHPLQGLGLDAAVGLTLATDVAVVLVGGLLVTAVRTVRARRHHRRVLDLVAEAREDLAGAVVLDDPRPIAYCVPGLRSRVVVSSGALASLESGEVGAVLAHERAHTHGHHELVMLPLASMLTLLGWMPYARLAPGAVAVLIEMAADDVAARRFDRRILARALVRLAAGDVPPCALAASRTAVVARVERLLDGRPNSRRAALLASVASAAAVATPVAAAVAVGMS